MLLLLTGCEALRITFPGERADTGEAVPDLRLELSATEIVGAIEEPTTLSLVVRNEGTAAGDATIELVEQGAGVWSATPDNVQVPAGGFDTSSLRLVPSTWGDASVEVRVTDELGSVRTAVISAWVYEDVDGDGYASERSGGTDCDDTTAAAWPGAEEVWYDGIDNDCLGGDDDDQDGDGVAVDRDCDDTNPDVTAATDEVWNGVDDDCDGVVDDVSADDLGDVWIAGNIAELGTGAMAAWYDTRGLFAADGDTSTLWRVDAVHAGFDLTSGASGSLLAPGGGAFSWLGAHRDGSDVLVIAGARGTAWRVDLDDVDGEQAIEALPSIRLAQDEAGNELGGGDLGDVDGDGVVDLVVGVPTSSIVEEEEDEGDVIPAVGRVLLFLGGGGGDLDVDDADEETWGGDRNDLLGATVVTADVDDDGLADILVGEPGDDAGDTQAGALYLLHGRTSPNWRAQVEDEAWIAVEGDSYGASLGEAAAQADADVDGDGAIDLILPAPTAGAVVWYAAVGELDGELSLADADQRWTGDVGFGEAVAVVPLDGAQAVVVGSPDAGAGGEVVVQAWAGGAFVDRATLEGVDTMRLGSGLLTLPGALLLGATGADARAVDGGAWWSLATD